MKKILAFILVSMFFLQGCPAVFIGVGAVSGYALSSDSAAGDIRTSYRMLWDNAMETLIDMRAQIVYSKESSGIIKSYLEGHDVVIRIDSIEANLQHLKVASRKKLMPKPHFSNNIFVKIVKDIQ